jgi:hypothetical protein
MSSTERAADIRSREAFVKVLVPLAEALRAKGKTFFALRPEPGATSYFAPAARPVMTAADFELAALESPARFVAELARLWKEEGNPELATLAAELEAIAKELDAEPRTESDSVAPFVYTMF